MQQKADGLSQLFSSYGSDESDDSSSEIAESELKSSNCVESESTDLNRHETISIAAKNDTREVLPLPKQLLEMFTEDVTSSDDPTKHGGRVRTFDHFPGNWAMHVFIPFKANIHFESLVASLVESVSTSISCDVHVSPSADLHISVSRTVPIRHYWIEPIVQQLKSGLGTLRRFVSALQCPELYTNDEKTRSFVALKVMSEHKKFQDIVEIVDSVFHEFSLPVFYKTPSFHVSVAWSLGDVSSDIADEIQKKLQDVYDAQVSDKVVVRSLTVEVNEVHCKIGNKLFVFPLSST